MQMRELWRPVSGYEGRYEVSDLGQVRSFMSNSGAVMDIPRLLKPRIRRRYLSVTLYKNRKGIAYSVHRLVAEAFIGMCPDGWQVDHINRNNLDNRQANLRYVTPTINSLNKATIKLDELSAFEIRMRARDGERKKDLAEEFGISRQMVRAIEVGRTWKAVS